MAEDPALSPTGLQWRFMEEDGENGGQRRSITFAADIQPLSYQDLLKASPNKTLTIPLEFDNCRVIQSDVSGTELGDVGQVKATLESPFTSKPVSLVRGGWLPPALAISKRNSTMLVDRNVVAEIVGRFKNGRPAGSVPDFINLLEDREIRISPLLCALEGNTRDIPDDHQARVQLEEAAVKISRALPKAEVVYGAAAHMGLLGLISDYRASFRRKQAMLRELSPLICGPTARPLVKSRITSVIEAADRFQVKRDSLLVLALASAIAVPNGRSPASRLLKLSRNYKQDDAYNALCDLRALEILINVFCNFPDDTAHLCTADRDLALLWCGIRATRFERTDRGATFDIAPLEELLPGEAMGIWHTAVSQD